MRTREQSTVQRELLKMPFQASSWGGRSWNWILWVIQANVLVLQIRGWDADMQSHHPVTSFLCVVTAIGWPARPPGPHEQPQGHGRGFKPRCGRRSPVTQGPAWPAAEGREVGRAAVEPRPVPRAFASLHFLLVLSSLV